MNSSSVSKFQSLAASTSTTTSAPDCDSFTDVISRAGSALSLALSFGSAARAVAQTRHTSDSRSDSRTTNKRPRRNGVVSGQHSQWGLSAETSGTLGQPLQHALGGDLWAVA